MLLTCRACGEVSDRVGKAHSMTMYPWDGLGKDPNDPGYMCPECTKEYYTNWQDMWDEYYATIRG